VARDYTLVGLGEGTIQKGKAKLVLAFLGVKQRLRFAAKILRDLDPHGDAAIDHYSKHCICPPFASPIPFQA